MAAAPQVAAAAASAATGAGSPSAGMLSLMDTPQQSENRPEKSTHTMVNLHLQMWQDRNGDLIYCVPNAHVS